MGFHGGNVKSILIRLMGIVALFAVIGIVVVSTSETKEADAAGYPVLYASIDSAAARGLVEIVGIDQPNAQVTARIQRPDSGLIAFCVTFESGQTNCSTVKPIYSSFDRSSKGCASFSITFASEQMPTRVEIFDVGFIQSFGAGDLTGEAPNDIGKLNPCRRI